MEAHFTKLQMIEMLGDFLDLETANGFSPTKIQTFQLLNSSEVIISKIQ